MLRQVVFGDGFVEAELPDDTFEVDPGVSIPLEPVADVGAEVESALTEPIDTPPLTELARGKSRVLIAFDDATVPCYYPLWVEALPRIISHLEAGGVGRENISLKCANSLHRKMRPTELRKLIGDGLVDEFGPRLSSHDAEDPHGMEALGTTPDGHFVDLAREATQADLVVYLNCSTTRGFSGGWKSICVGLSSYRSIAAHHTPDVMSMSLAKNQMHEILDEMGKVALDELGDDRFFKVETVLANPLQVARIFGGSVDATRAAAVELNRSKMQHRRDLLDEKVDAVVYGVPDWSPYAAYSHTNPLLTLVSTGLGYLGGMIEALVKPGGTAILATPCPDRWDHTTHPSYKRVWDEVVPDTTDPHEVKRTYEGTYAAEPEYISAYRESFGFHGCHGVMALYPMKRLNHAGRVIVAGAENPEIPEHLGFTAVPTVEQAVSEVKAAHGAGATFAFIDYPAAINRS